MKTFLGFLLLVLAFSTSASAFDYFEHSIIGDIVCHAHPEVGFPSALEARNASKTNPSQPNSAWCTHLLGHHALTFGDLVALAGDHFANPDELLESLRDALENPKLERFNLIMQVLQARELQRRGVQRWMQSRGTEASDTDKETGKDCHSMMKYESNHFDACKYPHAWLKVMDGDSDSCALSISKALTEPVRACEREYEDAIGDCYAPTSDELSFFARLPRYAELASRNYDHFGKSAVRRAEQYRREAMSQSTDLLRRSIDWAFAIHHYTDRFAAGHIRTDRQKAGPSEAKRRHDYDNRTGLLVTMNNDEKTLFRTFGDDCLLGRSSISARLRVLDSAISFVAHPQDPVSVPEPIGDKGLNPEVPPDPRLAVVTLDPSFAWLLHSSNAAQSAAYNFSMGVRLNYAFQMPALWVPPPISQEVYLATNGDTIFVPIALPAFETLIYFISLPASLVTSAGLEQSVVESRRRWREPLKVDTSIGPLQLFNPYIGYGLTRSNSTNNAIHGVWAENRMFFKLYDRFAFGGDISLLIPFASLQTEFLVGFHLAVDLN